MTPSAIEFRISSSFSRSCGIGLRHGFRGGFAGAQLSGLFVDPLDQKALALLEEAEAHLEAGSHREEQTDAACDLEPRRLEERRLEPKLKRIPDPAPDPVVVAAHHLERVVPGRQVGVEGGAPIAGFDPVVAESSQPIAELHFFGAMKLSAV